MSTNPDTSLSEAREELPPVPWSYMPNEQDDWGMVRDAEGWPVANTCPSGIATDFSDAHPAYDEVRRAGPPQARAVAELLIAAAAEVFAQPLPAAPAGGDDGVTVDESFASVASRVCRDLPKGWSIKIELESGAGTVELLDEDGDTVHWPCSDEPLVDQVDDALECARNIEENGDAWFSEVNEPAAIAPLPAPAAGGVEGVCTKCGYVGPVGREGEHPGCGYSALTSPAAARIEVGGRVCEFVQTSATTWYITDTNEPGMLLTNGGAWCRYRGLAAERFVWPDRQSAVESAQAFARGLAGGMQPSTKGSEA